MPQSCGEMIELFGDRRTDLFDYVVDGMNFTPSKPVYENMRDGILASVATARRPQTALSCGRRSRSSALVSVRTGDLTGKTVTITESFDVPTNCVAP